VALVGVGCGDDSKDETTPAQTNGPVPASLRTVESASEDIIDLALAGKRGQVVRMARKLRSAANGQANRDLAKVGVPADQLGELERRAARVAKLAPSAPLLDVALASNQAFALVPDFFARYETPVPAAVTQLDYLDFEAKLESRANNVSRLRQAVAQLGATWDSLRSDVKDQRAADRFNAHVKAIERLTSNADPEKTQREAQHGLDLVDELEESFES
jgi:hypothetical protein